MKTIKIFLILLLLLNNRHQLKAQDLDTEGIRKTLSTKLSDFFPFPGTWIAEKGNKIIEINLKMDWILIDKNVIVRADKSKPNYQMLLSYKVIDRNTKKVIATSEEGEKVYDNYSLWPTVSINMNILEDPNYYPLKLVNTDFLKYSYSYQLMDYKNCFTYIAVKLTILPSNPQELIWVSEIMNEENQDNDMEEDMNCSIIKDNSRMTIPSRLIFKKVISNK